MESTLVLGHFHHLGVACPSLERARSSFKLMGYEQETDVIRDSVLGVSIQFLVGNGPRVELLEPFGHNSPLASWLRLDASVGYHFAYECEDFEKDLKGLATSGALLVQPPRPAVAFGGARVAFLSTRSRFLVELIDASQLPAQL